MPWIPHVKSQIDHAQGIALLIQSYDATKAKGNIICKRIFCCKLQAADLVSNK